jgi:tetratricopeptide (TPR) repeat protein
VVPNQQSALLVKTPADPVRPNRETFRVDGKLDSKGTLQANMQDTASGDNEVLLRSLFRNVPKSSWQELMQQVMARLGFGGKVSELQVSDPEDKSMPFHFSLHYERDDYSDWDNKQISAPLPPLMLPSSDTNDTRSLLPVQLGAPGEAIYEAHITLPPDYTAALPESQKSGVLDLDRNFAAYHMSLAVKDGIMDARRQIVVKQREIPAAQREEYNSFRTAIDKGPYYVVLNMPVHPKPEVDTTGFAEANQLLRQGQEALQRTDFQLAQELFRKATEVAPRSPDVWRYLGGAYVAGHDTERGLAMMRKQIEVAPSPAAYKSLAYTFRFLRRWEESIQAWRELMKAYPDDRDAPGALGLQLLSLRRYQEAVAPLKNAVEQNPGSPGLLAGLAAAYFHTQDIDNGLATLRKSAEVEDNTITWSALAYRMAEYKRDLQKAQQYAEKAAARAEKEMSDLSVDSADSKTTGALYDLACSWNALGWVYFRQGDLGKAEQYLLGSWSLSQGYYPAKDLAEVYLARKDAQAASRFYARALAVPGAPGDAEGEFSKIVPLPADRQRLIDEARGELSKLRKSDFRRPKNIMGSADFAVLLSPESKIQAVNFLNGDAELKVLSDQLLKTPVKPLGLPPSITAMTMVLHASVVCPPTAMCDFVWVPAKSPEPLADPVPNR